MSRSRAVSWLTMVVGLFAAVGWTATAIAQPAETAWPMQGQNARQTGKSPFSDGCLTDNLKWAAGPGTSGVILAPDGIYCFTDNNGLTAVNYDGALRWRLGIGGYQSPALAHDGTIYFGDNGGFYAVNPNLPGSWIDSNRYLVNGIKWQKSVSGWIQDSAVIDADGSVLVGTLSGVLYRFNPDGSLRWSLATGGRSSYALGTTPSIGPDGTIYIGSETPALFAITPDGKLKWKLTTASHVHGGPAVAPDGVLYCSDSQGMLYAVNAATGVKRWSVPITQGKPKNAFTCCSPSIDPASSTVYCGGQESLYAYGFDGRLKWRQPVAGRSWSQPAVGVSGIVFSHSYWLSTMSAFTPSGTLLWSANVGSGNFWNRPVIAADGTVYVGGAGLYAFQDGADPAPATIFALRFTPDPMQLAEIQPVTLVAWQVREGATPIHHIDFYEDLDGDGQLDVDENGEPLDLLLGSDANGADGWSLTVPGGFSAGTHDFLAVACDADGNPISNVVSNYIDVLP